MAAAKKEKETIAIKPLRIKRIPIRIVGDSPIIIHAWSEKAKKEMLDTQQGNNKTKKKPTKLPFDDFARALYWLTPMPEIEWYDEQLGEKRMIVTEEVFDEAVKNGARFGFPANSFKLAANSAAYRLGWVKNQMELRGSYFLNAEDGSELAEIKGSVPVCREDMVKVGMGSADLRYRPIFENWYCDMILEYNESGSMKLNDILSCLNAGGYACGAGEWRPERDGSFGRFHIETIK